MRQVVLFDAFELVPGAGKSIGIYNYAKNLWRSLQQSADAQLGLEWVLVSNVANAADFAVLNRSGGFRQVILGKHVPGKWRRQAWLRWGAALHLRRTGAGLYFTPKGFLPNCISAMAPDAASVVVVHDLIPLWYETHLPGHFGRLEELLVNGGIRHAVSRADGLVAISSATAADVRDSLGRFEGLHVVHNGVPFCSPGPRSRSERYLFAVSSGLPHKNGEGLLAGYRAYRELVADPLPLVVCGLVHADEPGVTFVRGLSDAELHGYYAHAEIVLFLSLIEGFGFPPVEAMSHGVPVLCSDIPSLREVTQDMASYVDPTQPTQIAQALELMERTCRTVDREALKRAAGAFSWQRCASEISQVIQQYMKKGRTR